MKKGRKLSIQWNFLESGKGGTMLQELCTFPRKKISTASRVLSLLCAVFLPPLASVLVAKQKERKERSSPSSPFTCCLHKKKGEWMYPGAKKEDGWGQPCYDYCLGAALKTEQNSPSLSKSIEFIMFNPLLFFFWGIQWQCFRIKKLQLVQNGGIFGLTSL